MRKIILNGIIERMEQVGDLERVQEQKRTDQNAFKLINTDDVGNNGNNDNKNT